MSELPSSWAEASSNDLLTFVTSGSRGWARYYSEEGHPFLRVGDINHDSLHVDFSGAQRVNPPDNAEGIRTRVTPDDILISITADLGRIGLVPRDAPEAYINQHLALARPAQALFAPYLAWYLSSTQARNQWSRLQRGATKIGLGLDDIRGVRVPLPPRLEQERIVAAIEEQFSRLDAGVAALERVRKNLGRMRQAVLQTALESAAVEYPDRVRLADVLSEPLRNGHSAKHEPAGTTPILTLTAVTTGDFSRKNVKMTSADPKRVQNLWVRPGDILIERSNTPELVGTARVYTGPNNFAVYPDLIIRARLNHRLLPAFAELALQAPEGRRYFRSRAQGISGSMPKIDQSVIEEFTLPLPPLTIQESIVYEVERQMTLIQSMEGVMNTTGRRLRSLRSSILSAAFSGKLVPQDPNDEPASVLLERIGMERLASQNGHKPTRKPRQERLPL